MRSDNFTGPSGGTSGQRVGPTRPLLQHDFQKIYARKIGAKGGEVVLANHRVGVGCVLVPKTSVKPEHISREIYSYRSIPAATPIRALASSIRRSTRTTLPELGLRPPNVCVIPRECQLDVQLWRIP